MTKRKPPATAWKPGQSGNPAGREKGSVNAPTRLRHMIDAERSIDPDHLPSRTAAE